MHGARCYGCQLEFMQARYQDMVVGGIRHLQNKDLPFVLHIQRGRSCDGKVRAFIQSSRSFQTTPPSLKLRHNN